MKKVLIITYYWPPSGGAGVQRWLKFAKYLPEFGWEPVILTVDPQKATYPQKDFSLLEDVKPDLKVFHTSTYEFYSVYTRLSGRKEIPYGGFANEDNPGFFQKLSRFVRGNFFIPDPRKGWNRFALKKAKELISEFDIGYVITTGTPHSTHLIGLKLKKSFSVSWLADFRDPWIDAYYYRMFLQTAIARWYDRLLEKRVLRRCDIITTVSSGMLNIFRAKANGQFAEKVFLLTNGFDPEDFIYSTQEGATHGFSIVYAGTMTPLYRISAFLDAVSEIAQQEEDFCVDFYGKISEEILSDIKTRNLETIVRFHGYVKHNQLFQLYQKADALLLVVPDFEQNEGIVTGKIFEYLASARPVLVIAPYDSDAARIVRETNSGITVTYDDSTAIKNAIMGLISTKARKEPFSQSASIQQYSRVLLSKRLANLLEGKLTDNVSPDASYHS